MKRITNIMLLVLWSIIISITVSRCWFSCEYINPIYYKISSSEFIILPTIFIFVVTGLLFYGMQKYLSFSLKSINSACLPLLVLPSEWLLSLSFVSIVLMVAIFSLTMYRLLIVGNCSWRIIGKIDKKVACIILTTVFCLMISYGWFIQDRAVKVLYLTWHDWGFFWNALHNSLHGEFFYCNYLGINHLRVHFSPALFLIAPVVWLFPGSGPFFLANSIIIFSGGLVFYGFCRSLRISRGESVLLAMLFFLNSGIFNLNLTNIYGFHEIYFIFPIAFGIFWAYEKKYNKTFWGLIIFSLLIKETVVILWLGYGLWLLARKSFRSGIVISLGGILIFVITTQLIMPLFFDAGSLYISIFRFSKLGTSYSEIISSPFTDPAVFGSTVFRSGNIYFLLLLILPFLLLVAVDPVMLIPLSPLVAFICLQDSDQLQNIVLQYQSMPLVVIFVACAYNYRKIKLRTGRFWRRFLLVGCLVTGDRRKAAVSVAITGVFASMMCWSFFAGSHISKFNLSPSIKPS